MRNTFELLDPSAFEAKAEIAASLLKAMSNPHRLMVLCRLGASEASVGRLQADSGLSQSALSQHLAVLRDRKLVETRREAQTIYYRLSDPAVRHVIETLMKIYCPELLK
ncbi:MAG: helix-turn-helix transcriptional regulator [Henriciella sp.]|nr:helix-turn-helix transcriptional regulator [Henriciella sp.]MBO6696847.1 helix-turn-helix transcriptional regulator [Henriciella sp.]